MISVSTQKAKIVIPFISPTEGPQMYLWLREFKGRRNRITMSLGSVSVGGRTEVNRDEVSGVIAVVATSGTNLDSWFEKQMIF